MSENTRLIIGVANALKQTNKLFNEWIIAIIAPFQIIPVDLFDFEIYIHCRVRQCYERQFSFDLSGANGPFSSLANSMEF